MVQKKNAVSGGGTGRDGSRRGPRLAPRSLLGAGPGPSPFPPRGARVPSSASASPAAAWRPWRLPRRPAAPPAPPRRRRTWSRRPLRRGGGVCGGERRSLSCQPAVLPPSSPAALPPAALRIAGRRRSGSGASPRSSAAWSRGEVPAPPRAPILVPNGVSFRCSFIKIAIWARLESGMRREARSRRGECLRGRPPSGGLFSLSGVKAGGLCGVGKLKYE